MKYEEIPELRQCPVCGSKAHLRKNASKRFQVHCKHCRCCTMWTSKPLAIITWYNNATTYENMQARKGSEDMGTIFEDYATARKKPESERTDAEKELIARIEQIRQQELARLGKKE